MAEENKNKDVEVPDILDSLIPDELNNLNSFIIEDIDTDIEDSCEEPKQQGPKKINYKGLDFDYFDKCATCKLALTDANIHTIIRNGQSMADLMRYLDAKYDDQAPSRKSVSTHIKHHFYPVEEQSKYLSVKYERDINEQIARLKTLNDKQETDRIKAILFRNIDQLEKNDFGDDRRAFFDTRRVLNMLIKTYLDYKDYELKRAGFNSSPEEMNNRIKHYFDEWLNNILETEDKDKAEEVINIINKNKPKKDI